MDMDVKGPSAEGAAEEPLLVEVRSARRRILQKGVGAPA